MTAFYDISDLARSLFALWTFILCVAGIEGIILSFASNRRRFAVYFFVSLVISYLLWQATFDISCFGKTGASGISMILGGLAWLAWFFCILIMTVALFWHLYLNRKYTGTYITPFAIKLCADEMSCGICYWLDSGRVMFSNKCINRLCVDLTDSPLTDGNVFRDLVSDRIIPVGDRVWNFTCRDMVFEGSNLHEMVAWDISEIHAKTEALRKDNENLAVLNLELKAYSFKIDEVVRREEILQAKVNIHDEMNRLMLTSALADRNDRESLDRVFRQWKQNALLLCMETEKKTDKGSEMRLEQLAGALGLTLKWHSRVPVALQEKQRELVFAAAQEAVTNAVKHAEAETMDIYFEENVEGIRAIFENDGSLPSEEVRFTGGLANLEIMARDMGAVVAVKTKEKFRLEIYFPCQ